MRILLTGQMRSGTTFLANLLNKQPGMRIIPDFLHIERLQQELGKPLLTEPLSAEQKERVLARFLGAGDGWKAIREHTGAALSCEVNAAQFSTLCDFYLYILDQIQSEQFEAVGHKTTCAEPILRELLQSVPDLHCIYLYRDPRDVVVSNGKMMGQSPTTVIENWKRAWEAVMAVKADKTVGSRLFTVRYENLIQNRNTVLVPLAGFLGRTHLVLPDKVEWHGNPFIANSSFADVKKLFDKAPIGRWKTQWPWVGFLTQIMLKEHLKKAGYGTPLLMKLKSHFIQKPNALVSRFFTLPSFSELESQRVM